MRRSTRNVLVFLLVLGVFSSSAYALAMTPQQAMRVGGTGAVDVPPPSEQPIHVTPRWELLFGFIPIFLYEATWEPAAPGTYELHLVLRDVNGDIIGSNVTSVEVPSPASTTSVQWAFDPAPPVEDVASIEVLIVQTGG